MNGSVAEARVTALERQVRRMRFVVVLLATVAVAIPFVAWRSGQPEVIRVRGVIVVDEAGRERIFLGSPVPDPAEGRRVAPATGLVINDSAGAERFGLGLFPNGRVVMGFDAPPGTGDERNRERLTLVADQRGGAYIRLLDRTTRAKAFLRLDTDNEAYLEFLDWHENKIVSRRIGARGDTLVEEAR